MTLLLVNYEFSYYTLILSIFNFTDICILFSILLRSLFFVKSVIIIPFRKTGYDLINFIYVYRIMTFYIWKKKIRSLPTESERFEHEL